MSIIVTFTVTAAVASASIFALTVVSLLFREFLSPHVNLYSRYAVAHAPFFLFPLGHSSRAMACLFWASIRAMPIAVLIMVVHLVSHLFVSRICHHFHFVGKRVFIFFTLAAGAGVVTFVLGRGVTILRVVFGVVNWFLIAAGVVTSILGSDMTILRIVFGVVNRFLIAAGVTSILGIGWDMTMLIDELSQMGAEVGSQVEVVFKSQVESQSKFIPKRKPITLKSQEPKFIPKRRRPSERIILNKLRKNTVEKDGEGSNCEKAIQLD
ncbi:hypothetical protein L6452_16329 [Arctium lappa]|uniref:Uncharacterized protein n=1 Tax=Arctium lappa TaxID=4217 RepID=A0ACB9C069_ARCLA|nr:hypothetical protein L6452_16329 [Arctium lappa]